ncbi:hypothetical protein L596_004485 [Steinernema carpocapsae]|uniref:Uncharacterized protein n=1 Tax=Steinernema carpocapsae TaxID=34508 RepID=A0A4U8UX17_STECR|nr:hypothetical protein L596_004485 [Steinernema carpocapsae]
MSTFIQFVVAALLRYNPTRTDWNMGMSPTTMFGSSDFSADEVEFFRVLLIVLQMNARDLYALSKISPEYEKSSNKSTYFYMINSGRTDPEAVFRTWMSIADRMEIEQVVEFLTYIKNDGHNEERYLPPFDNKNRKKWQNHFLVEQKLNNSVEEESVPYEVFSRFPVDVNTSKRLNFLSSGWKRFVKSESDLISVFLGLAPEDFVFEEENEFRQHVEVPEENPLHKFMKNLRLDAPEARPAPHLRPSMSATDFLANSKQSPVRMSLKSGMLEIDEIRRKMKEEAEFMNSVMNDRRATYEYHINKRTAQEALQRRLRAQEIQMNRPQRFQAEKDSYKTRHYNHVNRDNDFDNDHLTHQIRERLDNDIQALEDGLRSIQQVIGANEEEEKERLSTGRNLEERFSEEQITIEQPSEDWFQREKAEISEESPEDFPAVFSEELSFRSGSSTLVSIPLGASCSADASPHLHPEHVFRLDLSLLSPAPAVTGNFFVSKGTVDIVDSDDSGSLSTFEAPIDRSSRVTTAKSAENLVRSSRYFQKPTWLNLIPWQAKPSSVRILEMPKEEPLPRISATARSSSSSAITPEKQHYDSGFIETTEEQHVVVLRTRKKRFEYINGMSQNEIDSIVQMFKSN